MTSIIITDMVFDLPDRPPSADFTHVWLNNRRYQRLRTRMAAWLDRCAAPPTLAEFQAELDRQCAAFVFTDEEREDSVETEAILIAEDVIRAKLASSGFPEPKNLRDHALQLLSMDASYRDQARARLEAKAAAAARMASTLITD